MPWTVVVNPVAGRGRTRRLLADIEQAARKVDARVAVSPDPAAPARLAREAAHRGDDLVACGGDGVVAAVAGVAADTGRRLAIVPTGAGNDFARVLGYDLKQPLGAFDALDGGADRVVDLGRVDGRWYTTVTTSGFDSEVARWAQERRRLSGTALYVAAVLRTLAVYRPRPCRVTVDDTTHELTAWLVAVANSPSYGGGMRIAPRAELDDGLLDITVVGDIPRLGLLRAFPTVFAGTHGSNPHVSMLRGTHVEIDGGGTEVWADGERVGPLPATMEAVPGALTARVPRRPAPGHYS